MSFHKNHQKEVPLLKIKWWFVRIATIPVEKIWTSHEGAFGMTAPQTPGIRSGTLYGTRLGLCLLFLVCFALLSARTVASSSGAGDDSISQQKVAELIAQLGDTNYAIRESATQQLRMIADHAIDQLLDAADQSNDLETALRAQWILETVSLIRPDDPPEVAELLKNFFNYWIFLILKPCFQFVKQRRCTRKVSLSDQRLSFCNNLTQWHVCWTLTVCTW